MVRWRIYYADETTWDGDDPLDAPSARGVLFVVVRDTRGGYRSCGRLLLQGADYYLYSSDIGWHTTDKTSDLIYHLTKRPTTLAAVFTGAWAPDEVWERVRERAVADPDFPIKAARSPAYEEEQEP